MLHCSPVWNRHNRALSLQERRTCQYYLPVKCHTCWRCFINKSINKQHHITKRNEWWTFFPLFLKKQIRVRNINYTYFQLHQEAGFWQSADAEEISKNLSSSLTVDYRTHQGCLQIHNLKIQVVFTVAMLADKPANYVHMPIIRWQILPYSSFELLQFPWTFTLHSLSMTGNPMEGNGTNSAS